MKQSASWLRLHIVPKLDLGMVPAGWQLQPGGLERFFGILGVGFLRRFMALYGTLWHFMVSFGTFAKDVESIDEVQVFFLCVCACASTAKWTQSDAKEPETIGNYSSAGIVIIHFVFILLGITTYPGPANV